MADDDSLITFEKQGVITIARIHTSNVLDALNIREFGAEVLEYLAAHPGTNLLLDFQQVEYLSSAVLTELIRIKKTCAEQHGNVRLCALNEDIQKVFEITNLDQIFVIDPDAETSIPRYKRSLEVAAEEDAWGSR